MRKPHDALSFQVGCQVQEFVETMTVRSMKFMWAFAQDGEVAECAVGAQLAVERRTRSAACRNFKPNPKLGWTYADEDSMGHITGMTRESSRGRGPLRVGGATFDHWRSRMHFVWQRRLHACEKTQQLLEGVVGTRLK